ncbi:thiamine pyrophosphate-binding protein [Modestobacter sp. VKM Ac-2979]|uniref:thiamine pyrophosphate-binding protein n=1 Tax=unclassified Modestobacter TaxID=2643866 RepID=UPI0022ABB992|nr:MULTISPECIES: thiamine pyrophosphate-binding protein [unclassified Modestobacter]MCZ2813933.1 thiamine pyrophosphate-binding protein [Modestobacter sp. VKM Ac-2979]MCZ2844652.1 thiamine pyrophosphate-binding protein [Modestobacter sp. VKM Ac-2980]
MSEALNSAEVMAESLVAAGVTSIFAYPGDPIIEFMEQSRARGIDVVLARREGTAAFMAEGYAMATGGLGVCLSTLGPGSTAMLNGVAAAHLDRVPMLAISGQIESAREQYFTHQVVDHKLLYSPVTKWAGKIEAAAVATTMRKAISLATAERPGPVHLTIGGDTSKLPAKDANFVMPPTSSSVSAVRVHRADGGSDPMELLAGARRPVVLAGIGAVRNRSTEALVRFAEATSVPVVVAPMAKGVFPEDHPLFAGVLDMACNQVLWDVLGAADLIVTVGFDAVELIKPWTAKAAVLHIDMMPNTDQIYSSQCECIGDISGILNWLTDDWSGEPRWSEGEVRKHREALRAAYYEGRVEGALNPTDVVDAVREAAPRNALATCDVGSHKLLVGQGWQTYDPRSVLMTNGLSSMGFGVPAAIAAKLADPSRPVVAMIGDGGFAMTATEVRLAAAMELPVAFVVFVDGSLNRIELKQMVQGYESTATRIEDMDLVAIAEAMDCDGIRADSRAELDKALSGIGNLTRPLVVEARVDPAQYKSQF